MIIYTVEDGKAVPYKRTGHCSQCGACCCTHTITYSCEVIAMFDRNNDKKPERDYTDKEGWHALYHHGCWWWFNMMKVEPKEKQDNVCPNYDPTTKSCSEWQDEFEFKPICRYWPFHPSNLEPFPGCTFRFSRSENNAD